MGYPKAQWPVPVPVGSLASTGWRTISFANQVSRMVLTCWFGVTQIVYIAGGLAKKKKMPFDRAATHLRHALQEFTSKQTNSPGKTNPMVALFLPRKLSISNLNSAGAFGLCRPAVKCPPGPLHLLRFHHKQPDFIFLAPTYSFFPPFYCCINLSTPHQC